MLIILLSHVCRFLRALSKYITTVYPYFGQKKTGWKTSFHEALLKPCFKKVDVGGSNKGVGHWTINDDEDIEAHRESEDPGTEHHQQGSGYALLAAEAILSSPGQALTTKEIYQYVESLKPRPKLGIHWKEAIRRTLSRNTSFRKMSEVWGSKYTIWEQDRCHFKSSESAGIATISNADTSAPSSPPNFEAPLSSFDGSGLGIGQPCSTVIDPQLLDPVTPYARTPGFGPLSQPLNFGLVFDPIFDDGVNSNFPDSTTALADAIPSTNYHINPPLAPGFPPASTSYLGGANHTNSLKLLFDTMEVLGLFFKSPTSDNLSLGQWVGALYDQFLYDLAAKSPDMHTDGGIRPYLCGKPVIGESFNEHVYMRTNMFGIWERVQYKIGTRKSWDRVFYYLFPLEHENSDPATPSDYCRFSYYTTWCRFIQFNDSNTVLLVRMALYHLVDKFTWLPDAGPSQIWATTSQAHYQRLPTDSSGPAPTRILNRM